MVDSLVGIIYSFSLDLSWLGYSPPLCEGECRTTVERLNTLPSFVFALEQIALLKVTYCISILRLRGDKTPRSGSSHLLSPERRGVFRSSASLCYLVGDISILSKDLPFVNIFSAFWATTGSGELLKKKLVYDPYRTPTTVKLWVFVSQLLNSMESSLAHPNRPSNWLLFSHNRTIITRKVHYLFSIQSAPLCQYLLGLYGTQCRPAPLRPSPQHESLDNTS